MSLAEQLLKLQIPGQAVIQQISSKCVSLLFDARTAASLDNEAIQNIGLQGFKELLLIDPIFSQFDQMFIASSLHFQRNMENENFTKKIKVKIKNYLIFLTPYLLLKPAQKTLEWLLRKYQCHIWDKEALMAGILPFHESHLFARIIQLFGTGLKNDEWDWLLPCQKEGSGFSTQSLINHCITNRNLLSFVCKMANNAKDAVKQNPKSGLKILFSFHAQILTAVIEKTSVINEDFLSFFLPVIHSGLKSMEKEYICSSYMIVACLSSKAKLTSDVNKAMLAVVVKSMEQAWYEEGLLCILTVLIYQNVNKLSKRVFGLFLLLKWEQFIDLLGKVEKWYDISILIDKLIPLLCKSIVSNNEVCEKSFDVLKCFIDNLQLDKKQITVICRCVIGEVTENSFEYVNDGDCVPQHVKDVISLLGRRFPSLFDKSVADFFKDFCSKDDETNLKRLKQVTRNCLSSAKYHTFNDSELPLVLSLNHPEPFIRIVAVEQLFTTFKSGITVSDEHFYTDAVIARLNDDNADVVNVVLKYPKCIIKLLPADILLNVVMNLMQRSDAHFSVNELIVATILNFPNDATSADINHFVYSIFGQLLYAFSGKRNKKLVEALDSVEFDTTNNVILKGIAKALFHIPTRSLSKGTCTEVIVVSAFISLVQYIADAILYEEKGIDVIVDLWKYREQLSMDHDMQFIVLMLLIMLVTKSPKLNVKLLELDFGKYLGQQISPGKTDYLSKQIYDIFKTSNDDIIKYLFKGYYSWLKFNTNCDINELVDETFFIFLKIIIQSFADKKQHDSSEEAILKKEILFTILSVQSVNTNPPYASIFCHLLNQFLTEAFIDKEELISFLCVIYMKLTEQNEQNDQIFNAAISSLHITKQLLSKYDKEIILKIGNYVNPTHLALLSSPLPLIRKIVLNNIRSLYEITLSKKKTLWNYVLHKVIDDENEILMDPSYMKKCLQLCFAVKNSDLKRDFRDLIQTKSKGNKITEQKIASLRYITKSMQGYPVSLQVCLLDSLELVDSNLTMQDYMNILKNILDKPLISSREINVAQLVLKCIKPEMLNSQDGIFPLFSQCLNSSSSLVQNSVFQLLTPSFYEGMSISLRCLVVEELLKILLASNSVVVSTKIRVILRSINLDSEHVASLLELFCDKFDQTYTVAKTSTDDISVVLNEDIMKTPLWHSLIELLEAVSKKNTDYPALIVPAVFHVLERCINCSNVEYVKQLLLLTLLILTRQNLSKLSEDQFKVELLIQCLQSSSDTQTTHQCLMVLSNATRLYPTRVLHNIMHIFSFMGGTMLRLDNEYSFEIIVKTIDAVIPVLIKKDKEIKSRKRPSSSSMEEIITYILQTFIDSMPHCPEHRRQHIIKHLVRILQASEHLHTVMILLLKKAMQQNIKKVSEEGNMELSPISLEFCKDFFSTYPIPTQIHSLYKMIAYLNCMMDKNTSTHKNNWLFYVKNEGDGHPHIFVYTLVSFAVDILKSKKMEFGCEVNPSKQNHLTLPYLQLLEELLTYSEKLGKSNEDTKAETKLKHSQQLKVSKQKVSELIGQIYHLLPFESFITIINKLLFKDDHLIRKKSLDLLCMKLAGLEEELSQEQEKTLMDLCHNVITLVKYKEEKDEEAVNKQLMLYVIKIVAIKLCKNEKETFLKAVPVVVQLYTTENCNKMVSLNAMLCVAELCSLLKTDVLPYLSIIMKPLLEKIYFESTKDKKSQIILSGGVTILHTILKSIPQFLSPYILDFLMNVSLYDVSASRLTDKSLLQKVTSLKEDIGKLFPPRILFPAVEICLGTMLEKRKELIVSVVDICGHSFKHISKCDANSNYSRDILNIMKKIFDVCCGLTNEEQEICIKLQNVSINAFGDLVLKLTENTLRPMYLELLSWCTEKSEISRRLLSFFRLSVELSKSLKGLFLLFVGHVLKKSKDILTQINTIYQGFKDIPVDINFSQELVIVVLDTLSNCFFYDSQGFVNKEIFESIMPPLVEQLENKVYTGKEYLLFVKDHLSPCLVNFAAAVNDSSCWKPLNYHILLKTKSVDDQVRLASLYVIEQIYNRMGESYMILIPETIPFLAEILEDDSLEVEKQCQKVVQQIEEISGESIQKYF